MDERTETEGVATVPYYVHESSMARAERLNKRMFILCIIELLIIVAMAVGFFLNEAHAPTFCTTPSNLPRPITP